MQKDFARTSSKDDTQHVKAKKRRQPRIRQTDLDSVQQLPTGEERQLHPSHGVVPHANEVSPERPAKQSSESVGNEERLTKSKTVSRRGAHKFSSSRSDRRGPCILVLRKVLPRTMPAGVPIGLFIGRCVRILRSPKLRPVTLWPLTHVCRLPSISNYR